jgi:flavodoxin
MARQIHALVGGDIVELETVRPYPEEHQPTVEQAKKELEANFYPPLKVTVEDISSYDIIFVGSPCWWYTFASPVRGFLAQHDFSGKRLAPFITHKGAGLGKSIDDMKLLCPGAVILEGLAVRGSCADKAQAEISQWLKRIGIYQ